MCNAHYRAVLVATDPGYYKRKLAYQRRYFSRNKEDVLARSRRYDLSNRYQMTVEEYDRMRAEQGFRCKGCNIPEEHLTKRLCVDHDHETATVRGLLCGNCNFILGHAYDNPETLIALSEYLKLAKLK